MTDHCCHSANTPHDDGAAKDPVCGMTVTAPDAPAHEYAGRTWQFCCTRCRDRFAADPESFLNPTASDAAPAPPGTRYICPMCPGVESDEPDDCPKCGMALEPAKPPKRQTRYTCPMHPEIVEDEPGDCPKCGMALEPTTVSPDTDDLDADPLTDQLISLSWLSFSAAFPGTELPAAIAEVSFETAELSSDPITGAPLSTNLNLTATAAGTAANYSFSGSSVTLNPQTFHLDVDGDGQVTAFGDGLMIIRKLLGNAFNGDALTDKAISNAATRSTTEIHQFIQSGIDNRALDIDQDGQVTAFSDGLMLIRSLLGNAFSGSALIDKAISDASPYYNQANAWQSVASNIDALMPEQPIL